MHPIPKSWLNIRPLLETYLHGGVREKIELKNRLKKASVVKKPKSSLKVEKLETSKSLVLPKHHEPSIKNRNQFLTFL